MATEHKLDTEMANLALTTFNHSEFKVNRGALRLEVLEEIVGTDTLYRLEKHSEPEKRTASKRNGKKRKTSDSVSRKLQSSPPPQYSPRKRTQVSYHESDSDEELFSSTDEEKDAAVDDEVPESAVMSFLPHVDHPKDNVEMPRASSFDQSSTSRFVTERITSSVAAKHTTNLFGDDNEDEHCTIEEKLTMKTELLKDLTARYDERNKAVIERDKTILELRTTIADKDREISELKEQLTHIISYERNSTQI